MAEQMETKPTKRERTKDPNWRLAFFSHTRHDVETDTGQGGRVWDTAPGRVQCSVLWALDSLCPLQEALLYPHLQRRKLRYGVIWDKYSGLN